MLARGSGHHLDEVDLQPLRARGPAEGSRRSLYDRIRLARPSDIDGWTLVYEP
jgi:hypothetical protein